MTKCQRAAVAVGTIAVAVGGIAYAVGVAPLAIDVCVTSYESPGQFGDSITRCSTTPSNVKIANLSSTTENLHNGCARSQNTSSTWNDCISSARIGALPTNQKVVWYRDANYSGSSFCVDTNGSYDVAFPSSINDLASSFRILGGNC